MTKNTRLLQATSAALLLALAVLFLLPGTIIQPVHASTVTIHLVAYYVSGWNGTTNPNPKITVQQGDTVTIVWSNGDAGSVPHQFLLDVDKDGLDTADCSPTADPCTSMSTSGGSVTFTASTAGSFTYYCTVHPTSMVGSFVVQSPGFSMASSPSSLTILQGSSATSTITLSSDHGFTGTLSLDASVAPTGPTASMMPASVSISPGSPATSTLTVSTGASTPAGTYTVTVNGASGSTTNATTVIITVTVPDFSIGTSLSTLSLTQGSTSTVTITLTSLGGFKGTLTLTGSVSQSGPTVRFSPASVTLSSGGVVTSNMTISASGGTYSPVAMGSYPVKITVTNGTLTHSTAVNVNVASVSSPASGLPLTILIGAAIVIVAVVGITIYLIRRAGRKPHSPAT